MPVIRNRAVLALSRNVSAFFDLAFGVTRPENLEAAKETGDATVREELERIRRQLANKNRRVEQLEEKLAEKASFVEGSGISPGNLVWIFGSGRTGSTWLSRMMGEIEGHAVWFEPSVGELFGNLYYEARPAQRGGKNFILGDRQRETWLKSIRSFVLDGANGRFPDLGTEKYLAIKEPRGSLGAPLLMEALPESRQILLVRDPRDMIASTLDAHKKGGWAYGLTPEDNEEDILANERPDEFVKTRAERHFQRLEKAREAYDSHQGRKVLVRYEDLRDDTLNTMRHIYSVLEIDVGEEDLTWAVEKHSWENVPEEQKGQGKFYRKASPGGWGEDLTPEQVALVEEISAPLIREFYS